MSQLPPFRHGDDGPPRHLLSLRRFLQLAVVFLVVGALAGLLFSRADPQRAGRLVVAELTTTEDGPPDAPGPDPVTPVTGPDRGPPVCGPQDAPLDPATQVATLASGVVLVQHDPELDDADLARLTTFAARDRVALAPNPDLPDGVAVVATSWRQRMPLERVDVDLLASFAQGHADRAPDLQACPGAGTVDGG